VGRSFFRDKRVPRENLNGLLVERTGMSAVLYGLTGVGGAWAQDPPFYAQVERFETGPQMDMSSTVLTDWHGWSHRRNVYFYHKGPVVVVDDAQGPVGHRAALTWHLAGDGAVEGRRIRLRGGKNGAEMLLVPVGAGDIQVDGKPKEGQDPNLRVIYQAPANGRLGLVTLFLMGEWTGAEASVAQESGGPVLRIVQGSKRIVLPLDFGF
jgi:hypothetical protein